MRNTGAWDIPKKAALKTGRTREVELGAGEQLLQLERLDDGAGGLLLLLLLGGLQLLQQQRLLQQAHHVLALRLRRTTALSAAPGRLA